MASMLVQKLSLSGAGFLGSFHLGVGDALLRAKALTESSEIAGASAGALVGAILVTHTPLAEARSALQELVTATRLQPLGMLTPGHSLVEHVREQLCARLPSDAHRSASGRLHVALTSLREGEVGRCHYKTDFYSRDELIDAVSASSDIPGITGHARRRVMLDSPGIGLLGRLMRRDYVDGGLEDVFPDPFGGTGSVVFVSPFAGEGLAISPPRVERTSTIPAWSPVQPARHGRSIEISRANFWRGRDALFPSHDAMRAHEATGFKRAAAFLKLHGVSVDLHRI
jgi:hypothetical protein